MAFRVRESGKRVVVQTLSQLVHFEGISSGTDTGCGAKQYQLVNERNFFTRWKGTLQKHRPNAVQPEHEKERSVSKRLLVIDAVTPTPDRDAGSVATLEMIKTFQRLGWRVTFIPEDNFAYLPETRRLMRIGVECVYWPHYRNMEHFISERGDEFDAVLMFRVTTTRKHLELVQRSMEGVPVLYHVADLHHLREQREAELKGDREMMRRSKVTKRDEFAAISSADVTIVHSDHEKQVILEEDPGAEVYVFPWIISTRVETVSPSAREDIIFIGGFRHPPNVDAVHWLCEEIWPLVRSQKPDAVLKIIGADAPESVLSSDGKNGVDIVGWVPELDPYLQNARATVAPLRFGAGIKGKVISSLAAGVPAICTQVAAEGIPMNGELSGSITDTPEAFAREIIRLLEDDEKWHRQAESGLKLVRSEYSWEAAERRVKEILTISRRKLD